MKNMMQWVLAATLVCGTSLFTACTSDTSDNPVTPVEPRQRVIAFEGIENARDMGSLVMQDGRTVRFDMLIRSAHLSQATDADVAVLKEQYHLSDVFDFRFDAEAATAPDRVIDGVSYTHLSTMPKAFVEAISSSGGSGSGQTDTRDLAAIAINKAFDPNAQKMARLLYPAIVTAPEAQACYGEFLRGVLNAKGAYCGIARRVRTVPDGHRHLSLQPSVQKERSSWRTSISPIKATPVRWMRCWLCCPTRKAATRLRLSSAP